jgi:hypothetical protein
MKIRNYILMIVATLSIFSCTKDAYFVEEEKEYEPYYIASNSDDSDEESTSDTIIFRDTTTYDIDYIPDSLILGREWTLVDGRVYVENLDRGHKNVYNYFDDTTNTASMSLYDPSIVLMDEIERGVTTWYFSGDTFLLNGQYIYYFQKQYNPYNDLILRPYGFAGGTSRPTIVVDADETHMKVSVRESYNSDNVYNYNYVSELIFENKSVRPSIDTSFIDGYDYNGRWIYTDPDPSSNLSGTKWVITRYNNGLSGNTYPNDTLDFISSTEYTINGGLPRPYTISNVIGNNMKSLSLYYLTTLGGDYSGQVLSTFMDDGFINNTEFHDLFNVNNRVTMWIERIN